NNKGAHEMTIVGYNDDIWVDINNNGIVDNGEKGAFKIANSWGKGYGNDGFIWLAYDAINKKSSVPNFINSNSRNGSFLHNEAEYVTVTKKDDSNLLAQFTMQHDMRNQLEVSLVYEKDGNILVTPYSPLLSYSGGAFPLDGINKGSEITFSIDLSHLEEEFNVNLSDADKIYLQIKDNLKDGNGATIKSLNLVNTSGQEISSDLITKDILIDGNSKLFSLDLEQVKINLPSEYLEVRVNSPESLLLNGVYCKDKDGNKVEVSINKELSNYDLNTPGKYKIVYEANGIYETRTLVVQDDSSEVISFPSNPLILPVGSQEEEIFDGVYCQDYDGDFCDISINELDMDYCNGEYSYYDLNKPGTYTVTYKAQGWGKIYTGIRTIIVQ
ncbi:hypothetical protein ACSXAY_18975, partial (plasmid) [Clostridium perfringens]